MADGEENYWRVKGLSRLFQALARWRRVKERRFLTFFFGILVGEWKRPLLLNSYSSFDRPPLCFHTLRNLGSTHIIPSASITVLVHFSTHSSIHPSIYPSIHSSIYPFTHFFRSKKSLWHGIPPAFVYYKSEYTGVRGHALKWCKFYAVNTLIY